MNTCIRFVLGLIVELEARFKPVLVLSLTPAMGLCVCLLTADSVQAARYVLVMGNSAYTSVPRLPNPIKTPMMYPKSWKSSVSR